MPTYQRRNTGKTTLHHVCGHDTTNFNLDCFTVARVKQLEAEPCLHCRMLRTNVPVMALVAGSLKDGRFVEADHRLIDDEQVQFKPSPVEGEIYVILPKSYPYVLASRHEVEGVAVYSVLWRPKSQQKG